MKAKNLTRTLIWHNYELVKPEDPGEYLVTVKSFRGKNVLALCQYNKKMYGGWDRYMDQHVVAWAMPPEPVGADE